MRSSRGGVPWGALFAAHGVTVRWLIGICAAWCAVTLFDLVTVPLLHPQEAHDQMIDTGIVVGLVLPVVMGARLLDEGPAHLTRTASRRLGLARFGWAIAVTGASIGAATVVAAVVPVSSPLVITDAALLMGASTLGAAIVGARLAWIFPFATVAVFSAPGVVPWEDNLLYRASTADDTGWVALGIVLCGLAAYTYRGSR